MATFADIPDGDCRRMRVSVKGIDRLIYICKAVQSRLAISPDSKVVLLCSGNASSKFYKLLFEALQRMNLKRVTALYVNEGEKNDDESYASKVEAFESGTNKVSR